MKESTLQTMCVDYLSVVAVRHPELFFFSIPNEGIMMALMSFGISKNIAVRIVTFFKKMGLIPGIPDFQILFKGEMFFIEFKKTGEKPREEQYRIHIKISKSGFTVYVIDSFESFESLMRDYKII